MYATMRFRLSWLVPGVVHLAEKLVLLAVQSKFNSNLVVFGVASWVLAVFE